MDSEFISSGTLKPTQFICHTVCTVVHRAAVDGALMAVVVVVCIILKLIIRKNSKP